MNKIHKSFHIKKPEVSKVSMAQFERLKGLFKIKDWTIDETFGLSSFERFYRTLQLLEENEQNLLLKLTYRFEYIPAGKYLGYMLLPLQRLRNDKAGDNLIFITCTPKKDYGKVKSSTAVLYQLKGTTIKQHIDMHPMCIAERITDIVSYPINDKTDVVMVDDFVGTGETAVSAIDFIHELRPDLKDNSHIIMFTIAAMHEGIKRLEDNGVKTYCTLERRKALSEEMDQPLRKTCMEIMNGIENKLGKVKPECHFGYHQSEALISMERCPNNTFPVYWLKHGIAPYER